MRGGHGSPDRVLTVTHAADKTEAPPGRIRVILVDDHPLVLNGLYHLLKEHAEFEILDR